MSARLLFVHGTGVRGAKYAATLQQIQREVQRRRLPIEVVGCYWGDAEGARLRGGGGSIPTYSETGGAPPAEAEELVTLWSVLYTDPWYELRLLRHLPLVAQPVFGAAPASDLLRQVVDDFGPSAELRVLLDENGLGDFFDSALDLLRDAPELAQALATAPPDPLEHRRALGRALVAQAITLAEDADRPPVDGAIRDALVERLTVELRGYGLGVGEFLMRPVKGIAARVASRRLRRDRGSITDAAAPLAGDVLRFLASGDGARRFLTTAVADLGPGPVHLLGHSLGGIMCVDTMVRERLPGVASLTTVGSQAPFLYEIGALPGLEHPKPLPEHFPPWLNVFDRNDILSYTGGRIFGDRVKDVEVASRQPFPQAHSAYWTNAALWDALEGVL